MVNSSIKLPPSSEYGAFLTVSDMAELLKVSRFWVFPDCTFLDISRTAQGFSLCDRPYAENGAASRRQAGWSISCPHRRFFQMVGERSQTGAKKYFEGLLEVTGSPFPLYMNVTLFASHSVTFSNSASEQNLSKKKK